MRKKAVDINQAGQCVVGINLLFDEVRTLKGIKSDAQLSFLLHVAPPVVSKMRNGDLALGDSMVLKLHEKGGLTVPHVRKMLIPESE